MGTNVCRQIGKINICPEKWGQSMSAEKRELLCAEKMGPINTCQ